jgi:hypothetical protein
MGLNPVQTFLADWRRRLPYRRYRDLEDRPRRLAAQNLSLLTLFLGALYLAWLGPLMWHAPGDQAILFFIADLLPRPCPICCSCSWPGTFGSSATIVPRDLTSKPTRRLMFS